MVALCSTSTAREYIVVVGDHVSTAAITEAIALSSDASCNITVVRRGIIPIHLDPTGRFTRVYDLSYPCFKPNNPRTATKTPEEKQRFHEMLAAQHLAQKNLAKKSRAIKNPRYEKVR